MATLLGSRPTATSPSFTGVAALASNTEMVLVSGLRLTVERVRPVLTKLVVLWELMLLSLLMVVVPALMMSVLLSGGVLRGWCEGVRNKGLMGGEGEDDSDEGPEDVGCGG